MVKKRNNKQVDYDFLTESNYIQTKETVYTENDSSFSAIPEVKVVAKNNSQIELIKSIKNNEVTICVGSAGSGKTFVSLGLALNLLKKSKGYNKIYLVKSVRTLKEEELGFMKGDLMNKLEPVMKSFVLNLQKLIPAKLVNSLIDKEILVPFPVAYMRGVTLDDCIIVVDEAQNLTFDNIRTIMTRIGSNCKLVILGDLNQVDLVNREESSLKILVDLFDKTEKFGVVKMSDEDENVRNPLIKVIEEKMNKFIKDNYHINTKMIYG